MESPYSERSGAVESPANTQQPRRPVQANYRYSVSVRPPLLLLPLLVLPPLLVLRQLLVSLLLHPTHELRAASLEMSSAAISRHPQLPAASSAASWRQPTERAQSHSAISSHQESSGVINSHQQPLAARASLKSTRPSPLLSILSRSAWHESSSREHMPASASSSAESVPERSRSSCSNQTASIPR